jgi:hypothetical protein
VLAAFDCETSPDELETLCFQPSGFSIATKVTYGGGTSGQSGMRNGLFVRNDPINLTDPLGLWVPPSSNHNVDPGVHLNAGEFLGAVGSGAWSGLTGASGKGMAQTAVGVGAAWSGVATMNPYAVVGGVGLIGIGLTNYFGGLFEGPDFKGPPLLPDMDVETWKAWNEARKRQEQKDQEDCKHKKTRQFTIHFFNGDPNDPNTTETGAVKFVY